MTVVDSSSWRDEGSSMQASELCQSLQQHHILVENKKPLCNYQCGKKLQNCPAKEIQLHRE